MTDVVCNVRDILGRVVEGSISIQTGEVRPGFQSNNVLVNLPQYQKLVNGNATFKNVSPGKAVVKIIYDGFTETLRVVVPNQATVLLSECLDAVETPPEQLDTIKETTQNAIRQLNEALERIQGMYQRIEELSAMLESIKQTHEEVSQARDMVLSSQYDVQVNLDESRRLLEEQQNIINLNNEVGKEMVNNMKSLVERVEGQSTSASSGASHVIVGGGVYPSNARLEPLRADVDAVTNRVSIIEDSLGI